MIYGAKPKPDLLQCAGTALWSEWRKFSLHHKLPSGVGRRQRTHFASIFPLQFKDKHHGLKNIAVNKIDWKKFVWKNVWIKMGNAAVKSLSFKVRHGKGEQV